MNLWPERRSSGPVSNPAPAAELAWSDGMLLDWLDEGREWRLATDAQGRVRWASRAFAAASGLGAGAEATLHSLLTPASQEAVLQGLRGTPMRDTELALRSLAGTPLWVSARTLHRGELVLWTLTDLSPQREATRLQREAQEELRQMASQLERTADKLKLTFELGHITLWRHDMGAERVHVESSKQSTLAAPMHPDGVPLDVLIGLIHPDDVGRVDAANAEALRTDLPADAEVRFRHVSGGWRTVQTRRYAQRDAAGRHIGFLGVAIDVTERVLHERQTMELARQLDLATSAAGIGLYNRWLGTDRALWNAQMYKLVGRARELGPPTNAEWLEHVVHPDDLPDVMRQRDALMRGIGSAMESEYRIVRPDGEVRWLAHRRSIEQWEGKAMLFGVVMDTTERRQAEQARQEKALAERASLAKSEFLARISHELRTPLNAVLGFTQLLQLDNGRLDAASRQVQLAHIRSAGEHLLALIDDVLDLTSLESGQPLELQAVGWGELAAEVLPMLASLAQQLRVELDNTPLSGVVRADRVRLRQVLINLVSNAIKYNRPGGRVTLQTCILDGTVELQVHDTGRGLTDEQVRHLFEPFNRLGIEPEGIEGSGIGLVIVKALVDAMHGTVDVHSQPGVGTVFTLTLPRATEPAPAVTPPTPPVAVARRERRGNVLYIEDNAINIMLVEELVRSLPGLLIASETTGEAGLAHVRAHHPDLVLIDMELPDMNGVDVLRALRDSPETAATRCIALSANAMPSDIAQARQAGFDDYWTKPIAVAQFLDALEALFP